MNKFLKIIKNNVLIIASVLFFANTMSADALKKKNNEGDNKVGRKEKDDDQKSDKTIANRESMN